MKSLFKIVIIGDLKVGKTSIFRKYTQNIFDENYKSSNVIDFSKKKIIYDNNLYNLFIWDTCGDRTQQSISRSYYRGPRAFILVFDLSSKESFNNLTYWLDEIYNYSHKYITVLLIGNKTDNIRQVTQDEAFNFSMKYNMSYLETSVKENYNITDLFIILIKDIINKKELNYVKYNKNEKKKNNINNDCFCFQICKD